MGNSYLPEEQEKLLRELNLLDTQERHGILPERSNINFLLIIFTWIVGILYALNLLVDGRSSFLSYVLIAAGIQSFTLILAYSNARIGLYLSVAAAVAINAVTGYFHPNLSESPFLFMLINILTIGIAANQFGWSGYTLILVLVLMKLGVLLLFFTDEANYVDFFVNITMISMVSYLPVLLRSLAAVSRKAKKQEIRAEILSLQNQDLLASWKQPYQQVPPQPTQSPTLQPYSTPQSFSPGIQ
ncbi:MAG: hypothetical protein ACOCXT_03325 [Candidatus Dojkabacteria bacterium]